MPEELRWTVVRHGETEWIELGLLHGRLDSPLSTTGRRHAQQTAEHLRGECFDALYTSPLGRAVETAAILGQALGLTPEPLAELREMDFGLLEGRPRHLLDAENPAGRLLRPLARAAVVLTGESPRRVAQRVSAAVDLLVARHPTGRLLLVTHWSALSHLAAQLLDRDPRAWRHYGPWEPCSLSEIVGVRAPELIWRAVRLNDTSHLDGKGPP